MKRYVNTLPTLLFLFFFSTIDAQEIKYKLEAGGAFSGKETPPTWHLSNKQGVSGKEAGFGYIRTGFSGFHTLTKSKLDINWGADIIAGSHLTSSVYIQQAFADINWKMLALSVGQKERWGELKNHRLSTGGLVESGNARPIPQIRIEVPEYYDFFGTKDWFRIRGHIAYGIFTDGNWQKDWTAANAKYIKNVRYHSKAIFFKIGKEEKFPLSMEWGLQMTAQFGGKAYNKAKGTKSKAPTRLKDYYKAFIPGSGDNKNAGIDHNNIAGNHLGSWHLALNWKEEDWSVRTYYEHLFDDHSQMFMEYGLWNEQLVGIELNLEKFHWIKAVVLEYYNLKNQSGPVYHDTTNEIPDQISCRDDNYNHGWYNGWFNYGMTIGTPLATSPIYNKDGVLECYNNRVEAFHIGIEGEPTNEIGYRMLLTHSNNWGSYPVPFTDIKRNTAALIELSYKPEKLKGWALKVSYACDNGGLLGKTCSGMLTISKCGIIKF